MGRIPVFETWIFRGILAVGNVEAALSYENAQDSGYFLGFNWNWCQFVSFVSLASCLL